MATRRDERHARQLPREALADRSRAVGIVGDVTAVTTSAIVRPKRISRDDVAGHVGRRDEDALAAAAGR
jgi:hypothetical protein